VKAKDDGERILQRQPDERDSSDGDDLRRSLWPRWLVGSRGRTGKARTGGRAVRGRRSAGRTTRQAANGAATSCMRSTPHRTARIQAISARRSPRAARRDPPHFETTKIGKNADSGTSRSSSTPDGRRLIRPHGRISSRRAAQPRVSALIEMVTPPGAGPGSPRHIGRDRSQAEARRDKALEMPDGPTIFRNQRPWGLRQAPVADMRT